MWYRYTLFFIKTWMSHLNTYNPTYWKKGNWENWLSLRATLYRIYTTSTHWLFWSFTVCVQHSWSFLQDVDNEVTCLQQNMTHSYYQYASVICNNCNTCAWYLWYSLHQVCPIIAVITFRFSTLNLLRSEMWHFLGHAQIKGCSAALLFMIAMAFLSDKCSRNHERLDCYRN